MKRIHILESTLRYLLDEGRNAEKAKQKTIAVMKNYLSQNGVQGEQLEAMAMEYENSLKEWLFHANMPDSIIRLEPIMANVAMQLGFTPKDRDTEELYRLKDITNYIIANYQKDDFPIALNKLTLDNTSFDSLNELFGSAMDKSKGSWKPSDNDNPKPHYTVKRLDTFEEAHKYCRYTSSLQPICYLQGIKDWNNYTSNGKNAVYVLLRDGWKSVPEIHGVNTPYDDYGVSMIFVIIRPNGEIAYTNTRWNHDTLGNGPIDIDQSFTDTQITDILQMNYKSMLKPYTEEELINNGFISLSKLRKWVADGENIEKLCRLVLPITNKLYRCLLGQDNFIIYNTETKEIIPYGDLTLIANSDFFKGYAKIQREDGKWSFINTDGKQIGDWYKSVSNFENGYACVRRADWSASFINTEGQQVCDWYKFITPFHNGFASIMRGDGKWSFINTKLEHIGGLYIDIRAFTNGFAAVQREDGKWSFINTDGKQIGDWYQANENFNEDGIAKVQRDDDKLSFINTQGKRICGWLDYTQDFNNGITIVKFDNHIYYMNIYGELFDFNTKQPISPQNESYRRLNNLISESLYSSIQKYLLHK